MISFAQRQAAHTYTIIFSFPLSNFFFQAECFLKLCYDARAMRVRLSVLYGWDRPLMPTSVHCGASHA